MLGIWRRVIWILRKRYELKTKSRKYHFCSKRYSSSPTIVSSRCLWFKATVSLERDDSANSSCSTILHQAPFHSHSCSNTAFYKQSMSSFGSMNDTEQQQQQQKACTFNCTGLQVCLKVTLHKYAQVQDSQCIAHLWRNWELAVKTNGRGSNEVPNYLILNRCRQAKTHSP